MKLAKQQPRAGRQQLAPIARRERVPCADALLTLQRAVESSPAAVVSVLLQRLRRLTADAERALTGAGCVVTAAAASQTEPPPAPPQPALVTAPLAAGPRTWLRLHARCAGCGGSVHCGLCARKGHDGAVAVSSHAQPLRELLTAVAAAQHAACAAERQRSRARMRLSGSSISLRRYHSRAPDATLQRRLLMVQEKAREGLRAAQLRAVYAEGMVAGVGGQAPWLERGQLRDSPRPGLAEMLRSLPDRIAAGRALKAAEQPSRAATAAAAPSAALAFAACDVVEPW